MLQQKRRRLMQRLHTARLNVNARLSNDDKRNRKRSEGDRKMSVGSRKRRSEGLMRNVVLNNVDDRQRCNEGKTPSVSKLRDKLLNSEECSWKSQSAWNDRGWNNSSAWSNNAENNSGHSRKASHMLSSKRRLRLLRRTIPDPKWVLLDPCLA
jgi:hypothetical protein